MWTMAHAELEGDRCGISLEKGMETHSSILAWRTSWTEEAGELQSMGSQRVTDDWVTNTHTHTHTHTGAGYSLHNRLVFWKEGDLIINAGCNSGTVKVEKNSKGKREKTISYFTATLKNTSYSQGLLGSKWYWHFKNVHGMVTLSLTKEARIYNGKKTTSLTSGAGKTGQPLVKEWN